MIKDNKQLLEIAGIAGIIVSLIFLAYQVQQANRIAIASAELEVRNLFTGVNETVVSDKEIGELIVRARQPNVDFTEVEELRFSAFIRSAFNTYIAIEVSYQNGVIPRSTYESVFDELDLALSSQVGARYLWRNAINSYTSLADSEFIVHANSVLDSLQN